MHVRTYVRVWMNLYTVGLYGVHTCMDINTYCFQRGLIVSYQMYTDYFHDLHIVFK